ncbi:unnamed protein product [Bursaphelenchus xylophilus]|uniref:(pine wood nematode) hypothetical protein n=1 Tax=Bursaphelenchus xylophilus TaxID=6326 RepID=A0A7I8X227_BURXY|nr:unnamed protein product [Bursaphelenchus xylophilus]CAG9130871.1 unnamed protein product [Bursaphelenchus xylophilus]
MLHSLTLLIIALLIPLAHLSKHANQLYEDLLYSYNKSVRPVSNTSQPVMVQFGASLIRIIDVVSPPLPSLDEKARTN